MGKTSPPIDQKLLPAGTVLRNVLEKFGFDRQLEKYAVLNDWAALVGAGLAAHSRPFMVRGDVLEVRVDHGMWMQQLQFSKSQILQKINSRLEKDPIRDIFWRFGKLSCPEDRAQEEDTSSDEPTIADQVVDKDLEASLELADSPSWCTQLQRLAVFQGKKNSEPSK